MRKVCGVGVNDSPTVISWVVDGKHVTCPFYAVWHSMLHRCYNPKLHAEYPTYANCSVVPEWLTFTNFKAWMATQAWEDRRLDKDLLVPGNKLYGPDTCVFVSHKVNAFVLDCNARRGQYKQGVSLFKRDGRFLATINLDGVKRHIGLFKTELEAHKAWVLAKIAQAETLDYCSDMRVKHAVIGRYTDILEALK